MLFTIVASLAVDCPIPGHYVTFMEILKNGELAIISDQQATKVT